VNMEEEIGSMSLLIGRMADEIVHMIDMGTTCATEFCNMVPLPSLSQRNPNSNYDKSGNLGQVRLIAREEALKIWSERSALLLSKKYKLKSLLLAKKQLQMQRVC
jgi:hypothetical protein